MTRLPSPATRYSVVAAGGIGGALLRAGLTELVPTDGGAFPTALLLTQALGCGLAGLLTPTLLRRGPLWSLAFLTGALGSFTTYGLFTGEILALATTHLFSAVVFLVVATAASVVAATSGLALAMGEMPRIGRPGRTGHDGDAAGRRHTARARNDPHETHISPVQRPSRRWHR